MANLADRSVRSALVERLGRLAPDTRRLWGRMSAHQMVCHLNDSFESVTGVRTVSPATSFINRTLIRWVALRMPFPWPKGVPTRPEIDQLDGGGTTPGEWAADTAALRAWIEGFLDRETFSMHPMWGELSREEWAIWGFRHVDHHFRQFGV